MNSTVESEPLMVIGSAAITPEIGAAAILLLGFVAGIVARILLSRSSMIPSAGYLIDSKGTIPFWMLEKTCVLLGTSHSGT